MARIVLSDRQLEDLVKGLGNVFQTDGQFGAFVTLAGWNYDDVSPSSEVISRRILATVKHAEANNWLLDLIDRALKHTPDPTIQAVRDALTPSAVPPNISPFDVVRLGGGAVMVDRKPLRDAAEELADDLGRRILV